jgi:hypothetical protein
VCQQCVWSVCQSHTSAGLADIRLHAHHDTVLHGGTWLSCTWCHSWSDRCHLGIGIWQAPYADGYMLIRSASRHPRHCASLALAR